MREMEYNTDNVIRQYKKGKCICNFTSSISSAGIRHKESNDILLDIPYWGILRLLDKESKKELLFSVNYCPVCGRSVVKGASVESDNHDSLCTDSGSPSNGVLQVNREKLTICITSGSEKYEFRLPYHPLTGEKLFSV